MISKFKNNILKIRAVPETKHTIWMLLGQFFVSLSAFALTYVLANYVSKEVVGSYRFVLAAYATVGVFGMVGIGSALMQSVSAGKSGSIFFAFKEKLKYGFVSSLLFVFISGYYTFFSPDNLLSTSLIIAAAFIPITEAFSLYGYYLQGAAKFKISASFLAIDRLISTMVVAVVAFVKPELIPITLSYLASHLVIVWYLYRRSLKLVPANEESDEGLMPYAKHITTMSLLGSVTTQLDKYILFFFFGPVPLALYWVASVIPQEVARVVGLSVSTFFPRYVNTPMEELINISRRIFWFMFAALLAVCMAYVVAAPYVFTWFFPEYLDSDGISLLLMFGFGFIPYYFVWQIFSAKKHVKSLYYASMGEPVITLSLYVLLIPKWGLWGLVAAICIKTILMNIIAIWYLYSGYKNQLIKLKSNTN